VGEKGERTFAAVSIKPGSRKSERKTCPSGWARTASAIRGVEHPDLFDERLESGHQRKHGGSARFFLGSLCPPLGSAAQPSEQLRGGLPSAVAMAGEEAGEALLTQPPGVCAHGLQASTGAVLRRMIEVWCSLGAHLPVVR
jgi:hypothetical protein